MRAIVLAGGKGTRLRPYTTVFPKPLVPVGDYPILEIVIRQLARQGFDRITLSTGHLAELIEDLREASERGLFDALAPAWLAAEAGAGKIAVLESASERFGRERVFALLGKMCANETRGYWSELARSEGGSLDDLVRLLWTPLLERGFEFSSELRPNGIHL